MTTKIKLPEGDIEIAKPEEAIWMRARDSTEARIKATKEALLIDEAFLKLCEDKIKQLGK